jgi:hypothetical protein
MAETPERDYRRDAALGLPHGSVRALLALMITAGICIWLAVRPEQSVPSYLRDLMFIIMGHYFAARSRAEPAAGPPPLYLPRGSIRTLMMLGFVGVGVWLYRENRLTTENGLSQTAITLFLVTGFLLGVLVEHLTPHNIPRIIEDIRAVITLLAGAALLMLVFGVVAAPRSGIEDFLLRHSIEEVLAAIIGFYFGSKS